MNETLYPRHIDAELEEGLASARVVNIVGPRQVGKTTLVKDLFRGGAFITLDERNTLAAMDDDPIGLLNALVSRAGDRPVIIDEAQRSPHLALTIKRIVDERRRMGQFILTGSSNVFTTAHVADSLAGRVQTLTMLPLSAAEIHWTRPSRLLDWAHQDQHPTLEQLPSVPVYSRDAYIDLILKGGYPEIRALSARRRERRYRDYVDTIVDRDMADVLKVRKTDSMRRLIDQLAARTANEANIQELAGLIGVQRSTLETYLDVLGKLALVARLPAWTAGEKGRDICHPKVHLVDTGIVAALRNVTPDTFLATANPGALGAFVETFVYNEIRKNLPFQREHWRLYHWRSARGREIDILAEAGRTLVGIETKASATIASEDFRHLKWFAAEGPGSTWKFVGIVVYLGDRALSFGPGLFALPLSMFWATA
jgi:predicted AAA+ superfamily ATPase